MANLKDFQDALKSAEDNYQNSLSAKNNAYSDMQAKYAAFTNCKYKWTFPSLGQWATVQGCDSGVNASQHPGCGSKNSCEGRVGEYNSTVLTYNNSVSSLASSQSKVDAAREALKNFVATDPTAQDQIKDQDAKRNNFKYVVIAAIVIVVIGVSIWLYKKYNK